MRLAWIMASAALALGALAGCSQSHEARSAAQSRLVLLGTAGGPVIRTDRAGIASLIEVGDRRYLIDCGEGCVRQLQFADFSPGDVDEVFITHLHIDHIADVSSLAAFAWAADPRARIGVHGPSGTRMLVQRALDYLQFPEELFTAETPGMGRVAEIMTGRDLEGVSGEPVEIFSDGIVRVLAVENSHFDHLSGREFFFGPARSYSYRVETPDRTLVFSGDTGPSPALERLARGADILVCEVMDVEATIAMFRRRSGLSEAQIADIERQMRAKHLTPIDVGRLAQAAGVGTVILSHYASAPGQSEDVREFMREIRSVFSGDVIAGSDLQVF